MFDAVSEYSPYAGIGARETPTDILVLMRAIGKLLDDRGYTLRSGGAEGADSAFNDGTGGMSQPEIFLPWDGYNNQRMRQHPTVAQLGNATQIAQKMHPRWISCSEGARKMHVRNTFQILGINLDSPAKFVICWTKNGGIVGGTGQALRIAEDRGVPIHNLFHAETRAVFYPLLNWPED